MKILISGPPRSGKSTLMKILIKKLKDEYNIIGFLTPEVKEGGNRIGFDLISIDSNNRIPLARKGNYASKFCLGKYHVFIDMFNNFLEKEIESDIVKYSNQHKKVVILIDEIGKMELFSNKFELFLRNLFNSEILIIATIGKTLKHPIKSYLMDKIESKYFELTRQNQTDILNKILTISQL
ncbi:MAG: nucleoside-triphosphatase [Promethearchaeati archaeon]